MSKVLIVIPSYSFGGTNSSLLNFLHSVNTEQISICSLSHVGPLFKKYREYHLLKTPFLVDAWISDFQTFNFKKKIVVAIIKFIKRFFLFLHIDLIGFVYRIVAHTKVFQGYDKVIAFSEGYSTEFVSYIPTKCRVAWVHCNFKYRPFDVSCESLIYSRYNKIYAVSQYTSNVLKDFFPKLVNRIDYIYNIIDRDILLQKSNEYDNDLDGISKDEVVIVSIGRFDPIKQFDRISEIAQKISIKIHNFRWYIIGSGSQEYEDKIKLEIVKNDVEPFVKLVGYKLNPAPFLKRANLYVCLSKSEACPMVFLEANALNTYIISLDFPSAHELLNDFMGTIVSIEDMPHVIIDFLSTKNNLVKYNDSFFCDSINKFRMMLSD